MAASTKKKKTNTGKARTKPSAKKRSSVSRVALIGPENYGDIAMVCKAFDHYLSNMEKFVLVPMFRQAEVYTYFRDHRTEKNVPLSKCTHAIVLGCQGDVDKLPKKLKKRLVVI